MYIIYIYMYKKYIYIACFEITRFNIYITHTKSVYKLYSNFPTFTVLNSFQYYYTIKYVTIGTVPHYTKHTSNVKVVHKKETIMLSNNITEAVTQKQSTERCPKSTEHTRKEITTSFCKFSEYQVAITLKSQVPIGALPGIHSTSLEHSSRRKTSGYILLISII